MDRLRRHILNELVFDIDGDQFVITPEVKDKIRILEKLSAEKSKESSLQVFREYLVTKFVESVEDADQQVIEDFVDSNIDILIQQLSIGFKLAKPEQFQTKTDSPN